MISRLTHSLSNALIFSMLIIAFHAWTIGKVGAVFIWENVILLAMGLSLDFVCKRFRIIGTQSHLSLVFFSLLSVVVVPLISLKALVVGFIWLIAVFLAFSSWEEQDRSRSNLIYIGVLIGIAQTLDHFSVFLFVPFFVLFYQNAVLNIGHYLLSFFYFLLVLFSYVGLLFVMDIPERAYQLIPSPNFDYSSFGIPIIRTVLPIVALMIIVHLFSLRSYTFRYPNRSIVINFMLSLQLLFAAILVFITAANSLFILMMLPASILLAVGFSFKRDSIFVQAAFAAFVVISLGVSAFFHLVVL